MKTVSKQCDARGPGLAKTVARVILCRIQRQPLSVELKEDLREAMVRTHENWLAPVEALRRVTQRRRDVEPIEPSRAMTIALEVRSPDGSVVVASARYHRDRTDADKIVAVLTKELSAKVRENLRML